MNTCITFSSDNDLALVNSPAVAAFYEPEQIPAIGFAFTRRQVALMFAVTIQTVRAWSLRGAPRMRDEWVVLPHIPLGRRIWYRVDDVRVFADRMRIFTQTVKPTTNVAPTVAATREVPKEAASRAKEMGFTIG